MFSMLVSTGNDPVGDIHFSAESPDSEKLLLDFAKIKKNIQKAISLDSHALAGVQDKVSADRISLPVTIKDKNKSYILKLLQLNAFSYLIGNGDLHAKNISLLNDQLSPCYDIVCTAVYGDEKMALMFDGKNQNIKRKNFIDFGKRYGLSEYLIDSMLDKLLSRFEKNIDKLFVLTLFKQKETFLRGFFKKRIEHLK